MDLINCEECIEVLSNGIKTTQYIIYLISDIMLFAATSLMTFFVSAQAFYGGAPGGYWPGSNPFNDGSSARERR